LRCLLQIEALVFDIQQAEFGLALPVENQPDLKDVAAVS
jgi:hypothetical protein